MHLVKALRSWLEQSHLRIDRLEVDGDGRHFFVTLVSPDFRNQSRIARHRMVYDALGDKVGQTLHALSLKTWSPEEDQANKES